LKHLLTLEIPRRNHACAAGNETWVPGMECISALSEDESGKWVRKDYCLACWEKMASQEPIDQTWGYWKSTIVAKKKNDVPILDRTERAFELLHEALARGTSDDHDEAFVLALYLVRHKKIIQRNEVKHSDGQTMLVYEVILTEEMIGVPKADLNRLQVEKIQLILAQKLRCKM
jgi:hypothetical protein